MRADKSLKPFEIRLYRHYRVVHGVRIALAFVLTFLLVLAALLLLSVAIAVGGFSGSASRAWLALSAGC